MEATMSVNVNHKSLNDAQTLDELNGLLDPLSLRAGWNKHEASLWPKPRTGFLPSSWSWQNAKAALDSAGRLISTEQADRRNLFLVNPMDGNYYSTVRTLVCAYQMILPGERARSHRHTPNALRLVLDVGEQTYTVVNGVRIDMKPGDVVLTPGWAWHGHGNDGDKAGYWIDFLDVPLVQLLEPMFLEHWPEGFQTPSEHSRDSAFVFPWSETEATLSTANPDSQGRVAAKLGSPALPTIDLQMEKLAAGAATGPLRTTASQIVAVVSGRGRTIVGEKTIEWNRGDVMAIPSWQRFEHKADEESILFTVSDLPVMEKLNFLHVSAE